MPPPWPPCLVDMRRTAAREHSSTPSTLTSSTRFSVSTSTASRRAWWPVRPALLISAPSVPSSRSTVSNRRSTSSSRATSPWTAMARAPAASISRTTASAPEPLPR